MDFNLRRVRCCVIEKEEEDPKRNIYWPWWTSWKMLKLGGCCCCCCCWASRATVQATRMVSIITRKTFILARSILKLGNLNAKLCLGANVVLSVCAVALCVFVCDRCWNRNHITRHARISRSTKTLTGMVCASDHNLNNGNGTTNPRRSGAVGRPCTGNDANLLRSRSTKGGGFCPTSRRRRGKERVREWKRKPQAWEVTVCAFRGSIDFHTTLALDEQNI